MPAYLCRRCLRANTVSELVRVAGWQEIEIHRDPENEDRLIAKAKGDRGVDWFDPHPEAFSCSECGNEQMRLEEAVIPTPVFDCRTCGFRDHRPELHPETCPETPERIDPPEISAGQEKLPEVPIAFPGGSMFPMPEMDPSLSEGIEATKTPGAFRRILRRLGKGLQCSS